MTFSILWKYEKYINKLSKSFTKVSLQMTHKQVLNESKINIKGLQQIDFDQNMM